MIFAKVTMFVLDMMTMMLIMILAINYEDYDDKLKMNIYIKNVVAGNDDSVNVIQR